MSVDSNANSLNKEKALGFYSYEPKIDLLIEKMDEFMAKHIEKMDKFMAKQDELITAIKKSIEEQQKAINVMNESATAMKASTIAMNTSIKNQEILMAEILKILKKEVKDEKHT